MYADLVDLGGVRVHGRDGDGVHVSMGRRVLLPLCFGRLYQQHSCVVCVSVCVAVDAMVSVEERYARVQCVFRVFLGARPPIHTTYPRT